MQEYVKSGVQWRMLGWGGAALLLAAPFVAMRLGSQGVNWSVADFIVAGALLGLVGYILELAVRRSRGRAYRGGTALGLLGALLTIWANLAVGIVGSERNPANLLFFAALLVGIAGAFIARFRPMGMSHAMAATALSLGIAFGIALTQGTDEPFVSHWLELAGTSVFALLFVGSAALFRRAPQSSSSS